MMTLDKVKRGTPARDVSLSGSGTLYHRLLDMGFTPGAAVAVLYTAPFGDPVCVRTRGYTLTLRRAEAACITVEEDRT